MVKIAEKLTKKEMYIVVLLCSGLLISGQIFLFMIYVHYADCICREQCINQYVDSCYNTENISIIATSKRGLP